MSRDDPRPIAIEHDGLRVAALEWGGGGEPLVLLHPNGFCAGLFDPLARRLAASGRFRPVAVDLRGHGGSSAPPIVTPLGPDDEQDPLGFDRLASDVVAMLEHLGIRRAALLGQSLGGGVGVLVDEQRPGLIRKLVLCEAIAFDEFPVAPGRSDNPMATAARRRRAVWPDRETMVRSFGSRPPLDALTPAALSAYVQWGTVERPDGQVGLACRPEVEAALFDRSGSPRGARLAWQHLAQLEAAPVVLAGDRSHLPRELFEAQAHRAGAPLVLAPGGHFFLQEDTDRAERLVARHLA